MKKFEVCIRGNNFLIKKGNKVKKNAFYAARFVEAKDYSAAVEMAMDSFRAELKGVVVNDPADPPRMNVVDVREVYYFEDKMVVGDMVLPGSGFVWDEAWEEEDIGKQIGAFKKKCSTLLRKVVEKDYHIHSMFIHFTNALYPVAILFMVLFLLSGKVSFFDTYYYLMILATFSVPISYLTGIIEWRKRYQGVLIPIFYAKIKYGLLLFAIGGCSTLWLYLSPTVLERGWFLGMVFVFLNIAILPLLVYLGHLGGIIVHEELYEGLITSPRRR